MQPSAPKSSTARRILALVLIVVAVLGLAYVRFAH
jgi:hypothetical protein